MPYRDPERRKAYDRERKRAERLATFPLSPTRLPEDFRLKVIEDATTVLQEAVQLIQNDESARGIERGRALLSACAVALRIVEARDVLRRLDEIERTVKGGVGTTRATSSGPSYHTLGTEERFRRFIAAIERSDSKTIQRLRLSAPTVRRDAVDPAFVRRIDALRRLTYRVLLVLLTATSWATPPSREIGRPAAAVVAGGR